MLFISSKHMRSKSLIVSALGALALGGVSVHANSYNDLEVIGVDLNSDNPTYSGTFDLVNKDNPSDVVGFNPAKETIVSADAFFDVNPDFFLSDQTVTIGLGSKKNWVNKYDFNIEDFPGGPIVGKLLLDLNKDGTLDYTVNWVSGDGFTLVQAGLGAETNSIPEGGSALMLLGVGLMGLRALGAKLKRGTPKF
jgi:hypothetical protein